MPPIVVEARKPAGAPVEGFWAAILRTSTGPVPAASLRPVMLELRARQSAWARISREPILDEAAPDAQAYCNELLNSLFRGRDEIADAFFRWATPEFDWPGVLHVAAAVHALQSERPVDAARHAGKAVAVDPRDLFAQRLLMSVTRRGAADLASTDEWLRERFCSRPFDTIETRPDGSVNTCCNAWMPAALGKLHDSARPSDFWNSTNAKEIRRSIIDGDFRYCSRLFCPRIVGRTLPKRTDISQPRHQEILLKRLTRLPFGPTRLLLSHDRSCNLSCPSCREQKLLGSSAEHDRFDEMFERVLVPLMLDARLVKITGSGDPFGSKHFRTVLKRLNHTEFPNLRIELQTNGQLLDALAWEQLSLADIVDSVWISIDAARSETYSRLRRGGDFERLKRNLEFVADLRQRNIICTFRLDTVVQLDNLDELGDIVDLGRQLRADIIGFQRIRNWGTFDSETFCGIDVGSFLHPRFKDLQDLLNCPKFDGDDIDLGNLAHLRHHPCVAQ